MAVPVAHGTIRTCWLFWNTSNAFMATPVLQKPTVAATFLGEHQFFRMLESGVGVGLVVADHQLQLATQVTAHGVDLVHRHLRPHARAVAHVGRPTGQRQDQSRAG